MKHLETGGAKYYQGSSDNEQDRLRSANRGMAKGAVWMIASRFAVRGIGLVSITILARLLIPADFGVVTIAALVLAFLDAMSAMDFDVVLIQKQQASRAHYDTAWTLSIIRGALTAFAMSALAGFGARQFSEPRLQGVLYCMALGALIKGFTSVGIVDFRKQMRFDREFKYTVCAKAFSFAVTIPLAIVLRDYWALVIGIVAYEAINVVLSFVMSPYRPRLCLDEWRVVFGFSKWLQLSNVLRYLQNHTDIVVVGKLVGSASLGLYSMAYEFSALATTELIAPIRRVILPGYSLISGDPTQLRRAYLQGIGVIFCVGAPVAAGIGLTANLSVPLLLGAKWLDAVPLLEILALAGLLQIGTSNTSTVLIAAGRPHLVTVIFVVSVVIGVPVTVWAGIAWGLQGVAWGTVVASGVLTALAVSVSARSVSVTAADIISVCWRTVISLVVMAVAVRALLAALPEAAALYLLAVELVLAAATGAAVYVVLHLALWRFSGAGDGPERYVISACRAALRRIRLIRERGAWLDLGRGG